MTWTQVAYSRVPQESVARELASSVRALNSASIDTNAQGFLRALCAQGRFEIQPVEFGVEGPDVQAMLLPRANGGFKICLAQELAFGSVLSPAEFAVAHEIGHGFFYDRLTTPFRRLTPVTAIEERFCDAFARALLLPWGPPSARWPATVSSVLEASAAYGVSIMTAAQRLISDWPGASVTLIRLQHDRIEIIWTVGLPRPSIELVLRVARRSDTRAEAYFHELRPYDEESGLFLLLNRPWSNSGKEGGGHQLDLLSPASTRALTSAERPDVERKCAGASPRAVVERSS